MEAAGGGFYDGEDARRAKRYVKAAIGLGNLGLAYNMWDFDLATEDFEPDQRASLS